MQPDSTTPLVPPISLPGSEPSFRDTPKDDEKDKTARIKRYSSSDFTRQLLEHMRAAVRTALLEAEEQRDK